MNIKFCCIAIHFITAVEVINFSANSQPTLYIFTIAFEELNSFSQSLVTKNLKILLHI